MPSIKEHKKKWCAHPLFKLKTLFLVLFLLVCAACSTAPVNTSDNIIKRADQRFIKQTLPTRHFPLTTWRRFIDPAAPLVIYLEGDGHSVAFKQISTDPTPHQPLALELALSDPRPVNILYIARPGQYNKGCHPKYWSTHRFSPVVIEATNQIIDHFSNPLSIKLPIQLIGFSGGGGLAVLVAAHRKDVQSIITIAGDLDLVSMQKHHKTQPLMHSHNPKNYANTVAHINQLHLSGTKDRIVPMHIAQNYLQSTHHKDNITLKKIAASHHQGWCEQWPTIVENW